MAAPVSRLRIRAFADRAAAGARRLADGLPVAFVAALAAFVLVAILYTVATREPKEPRGYAEVTMTPDDCSVDADKRLNARTCERVSPGLYRVNFSKSLEGSAVMASRGSCCPGPIGASAESDTAVLVVVPRVRQPIRATVFAP
jgi:hypothetical protein